MNRNYIVAGTSLILVILLVLMMFSGVFFLLPRQICVILLGIFPLIILALLVIALISLMTSRSESTSEKIIISAVIIGLLVIIAGIFVPIIIFEAFFHNQGQVYEIPASPDSLDNRTTNFITENITFIEIYHKDGMGTPLIPGDPDYPAIRAECLERIRCINDRIKTGFSNTELSAMKRNNTYITIYFSVPAAFNTSYIVNGSTKTITINEATFFPDSEYDDMIIAPSQDGPDVWGTSRESGKLKELVDPVFQLLRDEAQNSEMPELSDADREEAIQIALEDPKVQMYTSGEYEVTDVNYSVLTRSSEGVESSERLPAVTIVTKEAIVMVYVDPEKKCVVSIVKNYIRNPVIGPQSGDVEVPNTTGVVTPTRPKTTPA